MSQSGGAVGDDNPAGGGGAAGRNTGGGNTAGAGSGGKGSAGAAGGGIAGAGGKASAGSGAGGAPAGGAPAGGTHAGGTSSAGAPNAGAPSAGAPGAAGSGSVGPQPLGQGVYVGSGSTTSRYAEADVSRDGVGYKFIANGWGQGFQSHNISWNGTSFTIASIAGSSVQSQPVGYPSVYCGLYSGKQSVGVCGLPALISSLTSVNTGWQIAANTGAYEANWDIWLSNDGTSVSGYLMVSLRRAVGYQPVGTKVTSSVSIGGATWEVWSGTNGTSVPIVTYVSTVERTEFEFNVLDFRSHAAGTYSLPGTRILAVAVGFEVWSGPVTNLMSKDFYVTVK